MNAFETADPFRGMTLIIMPIAGEAITVWTKRNTVLIETAVEASQWDIIPLRMTDADRAQSVKIVVNKLENFLDAFARIPKYLADLEIGMSFA